MPGTVETAMELYHRTDAAKAILAEGFRDATGSYMTTNEYSGVWLSDQPLDANEGAFGRSLLVIDVPEPLIVQYEWIERGKGFREFLVPAELVNRFGPPSLQPESGD
jgi:hypothetical protein